MAAEKMTPLTLLPPAPQQKVDPPDVFSDKAEVFVVSLVKMVDEFNKSIIPAHNATVEPMTQVLIHLPTILAAPGKAADAAASAAEALASQQAAATSEGKAKASENQAKASENVAITKAAEALASQGAAATSEGNAKASELAAAGSAASALESQTAAAASATAAATSEANAHADAERAKQFADNTAENIYNTALDILTPQVVTDAVTRATETAVGAADTATAAAARAETARDTSEEIAEKLLKDYDVEVHMVKLSTMMLKCETFVNQHITNHHHGWAGMTAAAIDAGDGKALTANVVEL